MKNPAMSVAYEGEELFVVFDDAKVKVAVPYTAEAVRKSLEDENAHPYIVVPVICFLDKLRADFERPDILAGIERAA